MNKRGKNGKVFTAMILVALVAAGIWFYQQKQRYEYFLKTPVDMEDDTKISVLVKSGESVNAITEKLAEKGLLIDEEAFKSYLKNEDLDRKVVAGRFLLNKTQTIPDIAATLTDSKKSEFILTITEGSTVTDIDEKLVELDVITAGEFRQAVKDFESYDKYPFLDAEKQKSLIYPLEGFLFPDTYFIDPQKFASEDLIQLMLNNFSKKLGKELSGTNERSLYDIIIMASIVEKEARASKDLPIVSGILWKRLDLNWMIGADATLLYLKEDNSIEYRDLQEDSPYNTRNRTGLPPGPICNPGMKSITAALHPEESPYFFYLTKPDSGEAVYAVTNEEHNANKRQYLY